MLLLCKWIILFIVISYLCIQIIFLLRLCLSDRSNVSASRLQPHPPTPRICMKVLRCFQILVFYMYLSDVRSGGCKCRWLGLGLCSVWHSKTSVRTFQDPPPQVFKWDIQAHPESDLHPVVRFAMGQSVHQQFFKLYRVCSVLLRYLCFFFFLLYSTATLIFQSKLQQTSVQSQTKIFLLPMQDYELTSRDLMKKDPPPKSNYGHNRTTMLQVRFLAW